MIRPTISAATSTISKSITLTEPGLRALLQNYGDVWIEDVVIVGINRILSHPQADVLIETTRSRRQLFLLQ